MFTSVEPTIDIVSGVALVFASTNDDVYGG
jgi:hypothetical protein